MHQITSYLYKEFLEWIRTGRLFVLGIIFFLFGLMNPAIALITPWLYEQISDSMKEQGIIITNVVVTALTSWQQYYKNVSILLLITVILFAGGLVQEVHHGLVIPLLTKGMKRSNLFFTKCLSMCLIFSILYWFSFGITYGYNACFWDNGIGSHLVFAGALPYILGIWLISLILVSSSFVKNQTAVIGSVGIITFICYGVGFLPWMEDKVPTKLLTGNQLIIRQTSCSDYIPTIIITLTFILLHIIIGLFAFQRKRMDDSFGNG